MWDGNGVSNTIKYGCHRRRYNNTNPILMHAKNHAQNRNRKWDPISFGSAYDGQKIINSNKGSTAVSGHFSPFMLVAQWKRVDTRYIDVGSSDEVTAGCRGPSS